MKHDKFVPTFIEARSPKMLRAEMLANNLKYKAQFKYYDIQTYVDRKGVSKWIAWYYADIEHELTKEIAETKK